MDGGGAGYVVALFIGAILLYFLPALIAAGRKHPNATAILVLNLLLGWTLLGWVVALVWSFTASGAAASPPAGQAAEEKACPYCAETIKAAAVVCRHCGRELAGASPTQLTR